jgi:hypothetical protein
LIADPARTYPVAAGTAAPVGVTSCVHTPL